MLWNGSRTYRSSVLWNYIYIYMTKNVYLLWDLLHVTQILSFWFNSIQFLVQSNFPSCFPYLSRWLSHLKRWNQFRNMNFSEWFQRKILIVPEIACRFLLVQYFSPCLISLPYRSHKFMITGANEHNISPTYPWKPILVSNLIRIEYSTVGFPLPSRRTGK